MIKPFFSVQNSKDSECLEILIRLHAETQAPVIIDTTHNTGKMWQGCAFQPTVKLDLMPYQVHAQANFHALPIRAASCDVVVFDPPHTTASNTGRVGEWEQLYGLEATRNLKSKVNIVELFAPFLTEAKRVLMAGGILLTKLTDTVRVSTYQWEMVEFVTAARMAGMTPCDLMIKTTPVGNMVSGVWKTQQHLRRTHSYWVVVRNAKYDAAKRKFSMNYERPMTTPMFAE